MSTKTCPLCAEDIQASAVLCRYCGASFVGPGGMASPVTASMGHPVPVSGMAITAFHSVNRKALLVVAVALVVLATVVIRTITAPPSESERNQAFLKDVTTSRFESCTTVIGAVCGDIPSDAELLRRGHQVCDEVISGTRYDDAIYDIAGGRPGETSSDNIYLASDIAVAAVQNLCPHDGNGPNKYPTP